MPEPTAAPTDVDTAADEPAPPRARRPWLLPVVLLAALVTAGAAVVGGLALAQDPSGTDHRFVIPAGTAERARAGEQVEILPAVLDLEVGDSITLVNEDDVTQVTGFLTVRPGETVHYRFTRASTYSGACTLHPGGGITIHVT